jgi:hypothetical protein
MITGRKMPSLANSINARPRRAQKARANICSELPCGRSRQLEPRAHIAHFGGSYGRGGYWKLLSLAKNLPPGQPYQWDDPVEAEQDRVIERKKDGHGAVQLIIEHPPTAAKLADLSNADSIKWANAKPCFVRYGRLPPNGRSRNHADGTLEAGISVYRGERLPSGEARALARTNQEQVGIANFDHLHVPLYIVRGDVIGNGSDGEPLLANAKIIRRAKT